MQKILVFFLWSVGCGSAAAQGGGMRGFPADDPHIEYMGRVDFSNPTLPRFWNPGTVVRFRFSGVGCRIIVHDEVQYGNTHNFVVVVVDEVAAYRKKLSGHADTLTVAGSVSGSGAGAGDHVVTLCKATEGIGWLEIAGVEAGALLTAPPLPDRK